jgi:hypothetical protein
MSIPPSLSPAAAAATAGAATVGMAKRPKLMMALRMVVWVTMLVAVRNK